MLSSSSAMRRLPICLRCWHCLATGLPNAAAGKLSGSGPFAISAWDPGKKLTLTARDDYWGGRAFVDSIEIEMGKSFRDQMIALDLGKADIIEVAPEQARRAVLDGRRLENSAPAEWMALVFNRNSQSPEEGLLRQALSLSIDRAAMNDVLLQGGGEPAGTFLPGWMTGYAFLFPSTVDLQRVGQVRSGLRTAPSWTLSYEASDPLARVMAERIALNARDAGLTLQPTNSSDRRPATGSHGFAFAGRARLARRVCGKTRFAPAEV